MTYSNKVPILYRKKPSVVDLIIKELIVEMNGSARIADKLTDMGYTNLADGVFTTPLIITFISKHGGFIRERAIELGIPESRVNAFFNTPRREWTKLGNANRVAKTESDT